MRVGVYSAELPNGEMGVLIEFGNKNAYLSSLSDAKIIRGFLDDVIRVLECPGCKGRSALLDQEPCTRCGSLLHG